MEDPSLPATYLPRQQSRFVAGVSQFLRVRPRRAFTLVEMLVVIGIVGVLGSLAFPALMRARETARRTQCMSKIRQLGLALQTFESQHGTYPAASHFYPRDYAAHAHLLPFLDQQPIYNAINFAPYKTLSIGDDRKAEGERFGRMRVDVFLCPTDPHAHRGDFGGTNYRMNLGTHPDWREYRGVADPAPDGGNGFFHAARATQGNSFGAVRDGLGYTVAFAERLVGDGNPNYYTVEADAFEISSYPRLGRDPLLQRCRSLTDALPDHNSNMGHQWLYASLNYTWYNHVLPPNSSVPDCGSYLSRIVTARSMHWGGVNVVFGDGRAKFISERVDLSVWRSLATRSNREVIDDRAF